MKNNQKDTDGKSLNEFDIFKMQKLMNRMVILSRLVKITLLFVIIAGIVLAILGVIHYNKTVGITGRPRYFESLIVGITFIVVGTIAYSVISTWINASKHQYNEYIIMFKEELELSKISIDKYKERAEIQFKNHQKELKRYYDINLGHLKWVFPVGIGTIMAGIGIIILSIVLFKDAAEKNTIPILTGAAAGVLIDFVGAVFIRMYMETIKASTEFHNKLIHSNDNLFANVLATKITDENLKNETFSEMAKIIARGQPEMKESKDNN